MLLDPFIRNISTFKGETKPRSDGYVYENTRFCRKDVTEV